MVFLLGWCEADSIVTFKRELDISLKRKMGKSKVGLTGKLFQTAKWGKCHCATLVFKVYILRETSSITETSSATPSSGV